MPSNSTLGSEGEVGLERLLPTGSASSDGGSWGLALLPRLHVASALGEGTCPGSRRRPNRRAATCGRWAVAGRAGHDLAPQASGAGSTWMRPTRWRSAPPAKATSTRPRGPRCPRRPWAPARTPAARPWPWRGPGQQLVLGGEGARHGLAVHGPVAHGARGGEAQGTGLDGSGGADELDVLGEPARCGAAAHDVVYMRCGPAAPRSRRRGCGSRACRAEALPHPGHAGGEVVPGMSSTSTASTQSASAPGRTGANPRTPQLTHGGDAVARWLEHASQVTWPS